MRKRLFSICFILAFAAEIVALTVFALQKSDFSQDTVAVNEIVQSVRRDFYALDAHDNDSALDYVVINNDGLLLYRTKSGLSETLNDAIAHRDTILDVTVGDETVGKIMIDNGGERILRSRKKTAVTVLAVAAAFQFAVCIAYVVYLRRTMIAPFGKLKKFAERVACGNLDVPLEMDRQNLFGAFTESFDIMRSQLKQARAAEAAAQKSKKELVAKLSHDIKTPIASIKAVSEVGLAVSGSEKDRASYAQIIGKADQINALVTNLFTATLEELEQLTVTPADIESRKIRSMLESADYLNRASIPDIPDCLVFADALRLQQVFDNIFSNSYKYADTDISVSVGKDENHISITVEDHGGGVPAEELPVIKEKFRRGSNAADTDGAGLGLYISDYFMKEMRGALKVENGAHGLKVTVDIALSGRN